MLWASVWKDLGPGAARHLFCTSSTHQNTPRHSEQPANEDLLGFPGAVSEQTSPASGGNFRLSHCKKWSHSLGSHWVYKKQTMPLEEQSRWKLECPPTKRLDKNWSLQVLHLPLQSSCTSTAGTIAEGKLGCHPSRTDITERSPNCPVSPRREPCSAEQARSVDQGSGRAATRPRRRPQPAATFCMGAQVPLPQQPTRSRMKHGQLHRLTPHGPDEFS